MKALIPCGGYGTRLYPITLTHPKALLEVRGKAIISHIVDKLNELTDVDEIIVISNNKFFHMFEAWSKTVSSYAKLTLFNDQTNSNSERLGQIGDLQKTIEDLNLNDDLLIIAGDNLFNFSLASSYQFFMKTRKLVNPLYDIRSKEAARQLGNAAIDNKNRIIAFEEKPKEPKSTYVSLGIYYIPKEQVNLFRRYLDESNDPDKMGYFCVWVLKSKIPFYGVIYTEKWFDIGWLESLQQARREFTP